MKKFFMMMILAVTLILVGSQANQAEAADYYVGVYENGQEAYLMTESIQKWGAGDSAGFNCRVKAVSRNKNFSYVDYRIMTEPSWGITKNGVVLGQGQTGQLLRNKNSVEYNIWKYYMDHYARR